MPFLRAGIAQPGDNGKAIVPMRGDKAHLWHLPPKYPGGSLQALRGLPASGIDVLHYVVTNGACNCRFSLSPAQPRCSVLELSSFIHIELGLTSDNAFYR